jgi:Uncharacterized protein conserved in bacteria (DUF2252)
MTRRVVGFMICAAFAVACGDTPVRSPTPDGKLADAKAKAARLAESSSLHLDKAALRAGGMQPKQIAKLDASAFRYFRMLSRPFEVRTCEAFRDLRWVLPVVAVHGDAHIEQFVVTSNSYGIEDFDQAGYGPAVVDLVRYAASIDLAARELGFRCDTSQAIEKFFVAYRAALDKAPERVPPPAVVDRMRRRAPQGRAAWLEWVDQQMTPLPPVDEARARKAWSKFTDLQTSVRPDRPAAFFEIVRAGELRMGFGSALERKILLRVRGPSADPNDDVVLEARAGEEAPASGCVWRPDHGAALHVFMFMALLGPRVPDVLGYVGLADHAETRPFWVQSWEPGYVELSLADVTTQAELEEVGEEAARQLAGHFWTRFPEQLRGYQRYAQLQGFDQVRARAMTLATELTREVVSEWERFRATP